MESLMNQPVHFSGGNAGGHPGYGGYGGGFGGGLADLAIAGALFGGLGNRGPAFIPVDNEAKVGISSLLTQKDISDTRRDVKDSESEIRESIHDQSHEFRHLQSDINTLGREALESKYQQVIEQKNSTVHLTGRIDRETDRLSRENREIQISMDRQFDRLERRMQDGFNDLEKRELQQEIRRLRADNEAGASATMIKLLREIRDGQTAG